MKIKRFLIALICALSAACLCLAFAACGESDEGGSNNGGTTNDGGTSGGTTTDDPDANLAEGVYVFYVYLDDGTTPVEGAQLAICYNTSETSGTCYGTPVTTDENGRGEFDISVLSDYTAANNPNGFSVHFNENLNLDTLVMAPVGFPDGYTYPANSQTVTLNDGSSYETAWYITSQVTTFTLVAE